MALTTTFIGLDEDAVGEGDSTETIVVDTWLQQRIQINNEALLTPAHGFCWTPISGSADDFTAYTGIRPYCSLLPHTVWHGYVLVYQDQTAIEITLAYHAEVPGSTSTTGKVEIRVTCDEGSEADWTELANTYSSGTTTGHQTITVTLNERITEPRPMLISIWARSKSTGSVATTIGDSSDGTTSTLYHEYPFVLRDSDSGAPKYFDPNSSGSPPDGDSLEAMFLLGGTHPTWPNAAGQKYDMMWAEDKGSQGSAAGTVQTVIPSAGAVAASATAFMHHCLMVRAIAMRPVFNSIASPFAATSYMDRARIAPLIEFGSGEALDQAAMVHKATVQPSIVAIGPSGRLGDTGFTESDLDRFAANGYAVHWPTVLGDFDGSTSGEHRDVINEGIWLRTENPRLEIRCIWVSCQHGAVWSQNQDATGRGRSKGSGNIRGKVDVTLEEGPGEAEWLISATVTQMADATGTGDWDSDATTYGSISNEVTRIPVWGADVINADPTQPPILRGLDSLQQTNKGDTTAPGFWFREGSLYAQDFQVLYETTHEILLADMTQAVALKPLRLKLSAVLNDFTDPVKEGDAVGTKESNLRLTLVSYTVIEYPEVP